MKEPGIRVVANGDVGTEETRSNGAAAEGFAIRLRRQGRPRMRRSPLLEKEPKRFELPGRIDLGDGIEIPAP